MRFSLGTLLLFVLVLAGAGTTWWNCEPWQPYAFHSAAMPVFDVGYTKGDNYVWAWLREEEPAGNRYVMRAEDLPKKSAFQLYDSASGKLAREIRVDSGDVAFYTSPDWHYLTARETRPVLLTGRINLQYSQLSQSDLRGVWDLETGVELTEKFRMYPNGRLIGFSADSTRAVFFDGIPGSFSNRIDLVSLPDFTPLKTLEGSGLNPRLSLDGRSFTVVTAGETQLYDMNGTLLYAGPHELAVLLSPDNRTVAVCDERSENHHVRMINVKSGKPIMSWRVSISSMRFSADGRRVVSTQTESISALRFLDLETLTQSDSVNSGEFRSITVVDDTVLSFAPFAYGMKNAEKTSDLSGKVGKRKSPWFTRLRLYEGLASAPPSVYDMRTGECLGPLDQFNWRRKFPNGFGNSRFAEEARMMVMYTPSVKAREDKTQEDCNFSFWRQVLPNTKWAVLRMGEFWATVALVMVLVWRLIKARKRAA